MSEKIDRRSLLKLGGAAALVATGTGGFLGLRALSNVAFVPHAENIPAPFTLGVASGDPTPDGVVLWTRLAPRPLDEDGGMPPRDVLVEWQVADAPDFTTVVRSGSERAAADAAHSVHVEVGGLSPATWYWYRFRVGQEISPTARTRTAPGRGATDRLSFAFASCQHYEHGFYTAQRHMADEPLDLVVFLGDYIYEGASPTKSGRVRQHVGAVEARSLADYRIRYAQYKMDADLQALHAAFPWVMTWDDHEVANDYSGQAATDNPASAQRVAAAYQAFYEHQPLRSTNSPSGTNVRLYRRLSFGDLMLLHVLDTRQYRSSEVCGAGWRPECAEEFDPGRSITGGEQERWLFDGLRRSQARWNVVANSVLMTALARPGPDQRRNADTWDGYPASRRRLLNFLAEQQPRNPIVVTGDIHFNIASEIRLDANRPGSPVLGSEFVGTSLTSDGDGTAVNPFGSQLLESNPHVRFANGQRGYVRCELTPQRWRTDYRVIPYVSRPGAPVTTVASFVVEDGQRGFSQVAPA